MNELQSTGGGSSVTPGRRHERMTDQVRLGETRRTRGVRCVSVCVWAGDSPRAGRSDEDSDHKRNGIRGAGRRLEKDTRRDRRDQVSVRSVRRRILAMTSKR